MRVLAISFTGTRTVVHYLTQLSKALSKANDMTVIVPGEAGFEKLEPNVNLVRFSLPSSLHRAMLKTFDFSLYRRLTREINHVKPEVVHITFELRFPFFFAWLLHRNYPLVITIHEPEPFSVGMLRIILINRLQAANMKLLARISDKIIVHGEKHKRYLLDRNIPSHKIEVIPHGEFSFFAQYSKGNVRTIESNNILFFGRITRYKGIDYLIEAVKLVKEHIPDATVTIAGEGSFTRYKRMIGSDSSFTVLNRFIADEEVAELFQKASVVVLPYVDGSQSGVISIAYAFKKPVVATDVGNFSEMVENGKTGFIVPPKNSEALAAALVEVLSNGDLRRAMGENGYKFMKEAFTWDKIADRTLATYRQALEYRKGELNYR